MNEQTTFLGYKVTKLAEDVSKKYRPASLLTGPRGAQYRLIRNLNNPALLFADNARTGNVMALRGNSWFTDKDGYLATCNEAQTTKDHATNGDHTRANHQADDQSAPPQHCYGKAASQDYPPHQRRPLLGVKRKSPRYGPPRHATELHVPRVTVRATGLPSPRPGADVSRVAHGASSRRAGCAAAGSGWSGAPRDGGAAAIAELF